MKKCTKCKLIKPYSNFTFEKRTKDGHRSWCKKCMSEDSRKRYLRNEKSSKKRIETKRIKNYKILISYLFKHPCIDCGETDPLILEFDHIKGIKSYSISTLLCGAIKWEKVEKEIDKCVVRCANCHNRKTFKTRNTLRYQILNNVI